MIRVLHTGLRLPQKREGIELVHVPALISRKIDLDKKLVKGELEHAEAISFFSPRAVQSVFDQGIELPDVPIFVVGRKTQLRLSERFGIDANYYESFSVFSSVAIQRKFVSFELKESRHTVHKIDKKNRVFECYETSGRTLSIPNADSFDWILITSPRGADSFFAQVSLDNFSGNFACLGKTTYEALVGNHNVNPIFERVGSVSVDCLLDKIEDFE